MDQANARGDVPAGQQFKNGKVKALRSSNQSIPNAAWTDVTLSSSEDYDTDSLHDLVTNPERLTASGVQSLTSGGNNLQALTGVISIFVNFAAESTGMRGVWVQNQSGVVVPHGAIASATNGDNTKFAGIMLGGLGNDGDYITEDVYQSVTPSAALNLTASSFSYNWINYIDFSGVPQANSRHDVGGANDSFSTPTYCILKNTATQSIPNNAYTTVTYNTLIAQNGVSWTSGGTVPITTTGKYACLSMISFVGNATGNRGIDFEVDGARVPEGELNRAIAAAQSHPNCAQTVLNLTAGQTVGVEAYQNTGGALNIGQNNTTYFAIWLIP